jgi:hypothetical protein
LKGDTAIQCGDVTCCTFEKSGSLVRPAQVPSQICQDSHLQIIDI